ncbi:hypothetical protein DNTS_029486, partial [Danionella cerebrum]
EEEDLRITPSLGSNFHFYSLVGFLNLQLQRFCKCLIEQSNDASSRFKHCSSTAEGRWSQGAEIQNPEEPIESQSYSGSTESYVPETTEPNLQSCCTKLPLAS